MTSRRESFQEDPEINNSGRPSWLARSFRPTIASPQIEAAATTCRICTGDLDPDAVPARVASRSLSTAGYELLVPIDEGHWRIAVECILNDGELNEPAEASVVDGLSATLGVTLPKDYTDFLREHNGGEGFVGDSYIIFFKAEELVDFNREYEVEKYAPGILLFASTGGGEAYGFDTHDVEMPIVRIPFIFMERQSAETIARDLADLFATLGDLK